jgi:hypothetical protein
VLATSATTLRKYDVAKDHPEVIEEIKKEAERHRRTVTPAENQLAPRIKKD